MEIIERLQVLRHHNRHDCVDGFGDERCRTCDEVEEHLDAIQAEIEELLKRIPAADTTPAHITLTAH